MKKTSLLLLLTVFFIRANAQLEFVHVSTKGYSSYGAGAMFYWGTAVSRGDAMTWDAGLEIFNHAMATPVFIFGYRYSFNRKGDRWYFEPQLAYTWLAANIPRRDSLEYPQLRAPGGYINQPDVDGPAVYGTFGYIFPGKFGLNIGLRYGHVFDISGLPANILSLRFSHTILFGRERFR